MPITFSPPCICTTNWCTTTWGFEMKIRNASSQQPANQQYACQCRIWIINLNWLGHRPHRAQEWNLSKGFIFSFCLLPYWHNSNLIAMQADLEEEGKYYIRLTHGQLGQYSLNTWIECPFKCTVQNRD
jgi:hypothetical protein